MVIYLTVHLLHLGRTGIKSGRIWMHFPELKKMAVKTSQVAPAGAVIIVSYPRIEGATGLPARVWAITA